MVSPEGDGLEPCGEPKKKKGASYQAYESKQFQGGVSLATSNPNEKCEYGKTYYPYHRKNPLVKICCFGG
jgi:hypothetical protein